MPELISVLMPVYNREKFVCEAVNSIIRQTYKDFVFHIYDDGSTDRTVERINGIKDDRIRLTVGERNNGVPFARNRLLDLCETRYAAWQDSDDMSNIYRLEYQLKVKLISDESVFTRFDRVLPNTNCCERPRTCRTNCANSSAMFLVDKSIRFDESKNIGEDEDWKIRLGNVYGESIIDFILYYVRFHPMRNTVLYKKKT